MHPQTLAVYQRRRTTGTIMAEEPVPKRKLQWYALSAARKKAALGIVVSVVIALGELALRTLRGLK